MKKLCQRDYGNNLFGEVYKKGLFYFWSFYISEINSA